MDKGVPSEQSEAAEKVAAVEVTEGGAKLRTLSDTWHGRHLVKKLRWYDGFIMAIAVPIFLFPDLGSSAVQLGVIATVAVWFVSALIGMLQSNLYAELALMFPFKTGSMPSYSREAYQKYTPLVGPIVGWGYWFGWCVVLSINGLLVGDYLQANVSAFKQFDPNVFPKVVGTIMLLAMLVVDYIGVRRGRPVRWVLGIVTLVPIFIIMFGEYLRGHFNSANFSTLGIHGQTSLWGAISLYMYWQYIAGWSAYATEAVAVHSPEYQHSLTDTPRALRSSGAFTLIVYALVPLGLIAALGTAGISANTLTPFDKALKSILGEGLGAVIVFFVIVALILAAQMSATASIRSLWQMAENGVTVSIFSRLNSFGMPDAAILFTYGFNILLIWTVGSPLWILAASNVGYVGSHIINLGGYLLLRKDRPDAARPIKYGVPWSYIAGFLLIVNLACMAVGAPVYGPGPLAAGLAFMFGFSLVLWVIRRYVQHVPVAAEAEFAAY
jgi:amino acid transporter